MASKPINIRWIKKNITESFENIFSPSLGNYLEKYVGGVTKMKSTRNIFSIFSPSWYFKYFAAGEKNNLKYLSFLEIYF